MQKVENNLYIDADLAMGCVGKQTEKLEEKVSSRDVPRLKEKHCERVKDLC